MLANALFPKSTPSPKWSPVANTLYQETVNLAKPQTSWLQLPLLANPGIREAQSLHWRLGENFLWTESRP